MTGPEPEQGQPLREGDAVRMTVAVTGTVTAGGYVHVPGVIGQMDLLWFEELRATCTVLERDDRRPVIHHFRGEPVRMLDAEKAGAAEESKGV